MPYFNIEKIPAAAISSVISDATILIIDSSGCDQIYNSLKKLYSHGRYKAYYTRAGVNRINKTIETAQSHNLKTVVIYAKKGNKKGIFTPNIPFTSSIITPSSDYIENNNFLEEILENNNLKDLSIIGYQKYRFNPFTLNKIREKQFEHIRLGELREELSQAEPYLRNKEHIYLDLRSIRSSDYPENSIQSPNGLYAEESCQLARYIGMSLNFSSLYIFGESDSLEFGSVTCELISEIIWHATEGLYANIKEEPTNTLMDDVYIRKIVSLGEDIDNIIFIKSSITGRWWMEIPNVETSDNVPIPCSYRDYKSAISGEIPLRWLFFFQKFNPS